VIRDPKTGRKTERAGRIQQQPRMRRRAAAQPLFHHRTFARRVPQVGLARTKLREAAIVGNSGPVKAAGEARHYDMTDPIADLLTRIRNAQSAGKPTVGVGARS